MHAQDFHFNINEVMLTAIEAFSHSFPQEKGSQHRLKCSGSFSVVNVNCITGFE